MMTRLSRPRPSVSLLRQAARTEFRRPFCAPVVARRDGTTAPLNKLKGFLDYERKPEPYRPPAERKLDYLEMFGAVDEDASRVLTMDEVPCAARCARCDVVWCWA